FGDSPPAEPPNEVAGGDSSPAEPLTEVALGRSAPAESPNEVASASDPCARRRIGSEPPNDPGYRLPPPAERGLPLDQQQPDRDELERAVEQDEAQVALAGALEVGDRPDREGRAEREEPEHQRGPEVLAQHAPARREAPRRGARAHVLRDQAQPQPVV